jgi:hypothetical protein
MTYIKSLSMSSAPSIHPLKRLLETHISMSNSLLEIRTMMFETLKSLKIECIETSKCVFCCTALYKHEMLKFEIRIYSENISSLNAPDGETPAVESQQEESIVNEMVNHFVEFKHFEGDRFFFQEILFDIGTQMNVTIPCARKFTTIDEISLSGIDDMTGNLEWLLDAETPCDFMLQGLQTVASCAVDMLRSRDTSVRSVFSKTGRWNFITMRVIEIVKSTYTTTDHDLCLVGVSTLAEILSVVNDLSSDERSKLVMIATYINDKHAFHSTRESSRLLDLL